MVVRANRQQWNEYYRLWRRQHPERWKEIAHKSYLAHREENLKYQKIYNLQNQKQIKKYRKKYWQEKRK